MARYSVPFSTGASTVVYVEADNAEEAIEKAYESLPYVCAQCSGWGTTKNSGVDIGDWEYDESEEPWVEE